MQQQIYDQFLYTQLVDMSLIDAHLKTTTGYDATIQGYSKRYWTEVGAAS